MTTVSWPRSSHERTCLFVESSGGVGIRWINAANGGRSRMYGRRQTIRGMSPRGLRARRDARAAGAAPAVISQTAAAHGRSSIAARARPRNGSLTLFDTRERGRERDEIMMKIKVWPSPLPQMRKGRGCMGRKIMGKFWGRAGTEPYRVELCVLFCILLITRF